MERLGAKGADDQGRPPASSGTDGARSMPSVRPSFVTRYSFPSAETGICSTTRYTAQYTDRFGLPLECGMHRDSDRSIGKKGSLKDGSISKKTA